MQRPRNTIFIVVIVFAIAVFAGLNSMMNRAGGSPEPEKAAQEKAAAEETAAAASGTPPEGAAAPVQLPQDQTVGPPDAKVKVVVGWTWTPEVQGSPQAVLDTLEAIRKAAPDAQMRVVNVDAAPDVPPGIQVNGRTVLELPENGIIKPAEAAAAISNTNR